MSAKTGIEWTDRTWNPVVGCTKVSQGCKLCYAKTIHDMRHKAHLEGKTVAPQYAQPFETVQLKPDRLTWPLSLRQPSRIFVNSVSDLFHEDVPDEFLDQVFETMCLATRHTFQVLTKRPARMLEYLSKHFGWRAQGPAPHIWLGVSVENQTAADERIPLLLETPAAVRFLSCEPLLGPVDLECVGRSEQVNALYGGTYDSFHVASGRPDYGVDWVIVGGESGRRARPMHPDWARSLRDQCVAAGVPFLFKQWGEYGPASPLPGCTHSSLVGKKRAGRELDGRTWDEFPVASLSTETVTDG